VRTLSKKEETSTTGARILIDKLVDLCDPPREASVLCIGCRNTSELDYFRRKGFTNTVGIDLFSEDPSVLVMDMHNMNFPDNRFDIIFSSHSLEHSYDEQRAVSEIVRVSRNRCLAAVEVPIRYETKGVDLVDFNDISGLTAPFGAHLAEVLWHDEQPPHTPANQQGLWILRAIFSIRKD
jgi:SAM-dependent methyltransferase